MICKDSKFGISFDISALRGYNIKVLKGKNMENEKYESPYVEIIKVEVDQPILTSSFTGEDIYEWEDMFN